MPQPLRRPWTGWKPTPTQPVRAKSLTGRPPPPKPSPKSRRFAPVTSSRPQAKLTVRRFRVDARAWNGWEGRPIAIVADGVASLQIPKGATADAYLTVLTGPLPGVSQQTALARLPLPPPSWDAGIATLELHEGSGRVLLASNAIPANHRTAILHISTGPLPDCSSLNLRWERPAVVVVRALTGQPHQDW